MPSLISHLSKADQEALFDDLNYLNLQEMRSFCKLHSIPYTIWMETHAGDRTRTKDTDRKSVVLGRIREYLKTGRIPQATCYRAHVVCLRPPPKRLKASHRLFYGWYDKKNRDMVDLLRSLTGGVFRNGAVARILAREFWTKGKAPTFSEYAKAWLGANEEGLGVHLGKHPEAAWLTDRSRKQAGGNWKAKRVRKAKRVLEILGKIRSGD